MSRILLVSANLTVEPYPVYPLGMAVVASALAARGHAVEQFDFLAAGACEEAFREQIRTFSPDFLGISLRNLDSCDSLTTEDYPAVARRLVELARDCTRAPIFLGGPAFSILPESLLAYTGADYGVIGEGEVLVAGLVQALEEGRAVPRLLRNAAPLDAEDMAAPLFHPELVRFYQDQAGLLNLQTKRGCPFRCAYCNYPDLEGTRYRPRDPRAAVEDLAQAQARFGVRDFFISDGVFNDAEGHHMAFVEELLRRDLRLRWSCYMRPQHIDRNALRLMKRAGLYAAELGTDAACDTTLRALAKGFTFDEVVEANEAFVACEVPCAHFVMFGGPEESGATVREGLDNLARLRCTVVFAFTGIRIFPGTPLHVRSVREGLVDPGNDLRTPAYYHSPALDPLEMNAQIERAFKGKRDRFFPPERGREHMEVVRRMGLRGILWDTMIRFPRAAVAGAE